MAALIQALDRDELRARAVTPLVVFAGMAICFLAAHGDLGRPAVILAAVVGSFTAAAAVRYPDAAACVAFALVIVVPTYWAQPLPSVQVASTAATVTGALLLPAAMASRDRVRLSLLDGLVAMYFLLAIASIGANVTGVVASVADLAGRAIVPYVVFRILASREGASRRLASTLVAAAVPLALIGLRESAGNGNPFFTLVRPGFEASRWLRSQVRFGEIRAESSFGHAIAFSLFLAIALLLVLGLSWRLGAMSRVVLAASGCLIVAALFATGSRGGVLSVIVGVLVWAVSLRGRRTGLLVLAAVVTLGLVVTPAGDQLAQLRDSLSDSSEAGQAAQYRLEVAKVVSDPDVFSLLGKESPADSDLGPVNAAKEQIGLRTIDSQYAVIYITTGVAGLMAFVAIELALFVTVLRRKLDPLERAWAAAAAATGVALVSVALFTQMLSLFWICVAITAADGSRATD